MANINGMPVEVIAIDTENHTQLLGNSIIANKTSDSFATVLEDFLNLGVKPFRIIVIDHLQVQYDAIRKIFASSFIVFSLINIRRDLLLYFNVDGPIIQGLFSSMQAHNYKANNY